MKKTAFFASFTILMALLFAAPALQAQQKSQKAAPKGHHATMDKKAAMQRKECFGGHGMGCMGMLKERLGLSEEQAGKIDTITLNFRKKMLENREKAAPKRISLQRLMLEDTIDLGRVRALVGEISDLGAESRMLKIERKVEIEKVLTPEQKTRFRAMTMNCCSGRCPMMQKGGDRGPGMHGGGNHDSKTHGGQAK